MNKFIAILSDKNEKHLHEVYQRAVAALRPSSPKGIQILPHIVLFEMQGDLESAAHTLRSGLEPQDQFLLMKVYCDFRGVAKPERMEDLLSFFSM
jgi:hypothetical protein